MDTAAEVQRRGTTTQLASCECSDTDVRAVNEKFHWRNPLLGPFSC